MKKKAKIAIVALAVGVIGTITCVALRKRV
jgi:hypothetical protein